jgi:hypothetical protein
MGRLYNAQEEPDPLKWYENEREVASARKQIPCRQAWYSVNRFVDPALRVDDRQQIHICIAGHEGG